MPRTMMLPHVSIELKLSDGLYQLCKGARLMNIYARNALGDELIKHHQLRIPKHFRLGIQSRYRYQARKLATKEKKAQYWKVPPGLDLIRTGQLAKAVKTNKTVTFSGAFGGEDSNSTLQGRLRMRMARPLYRGKGNGITPDQIIDEIKRTTNDEDREIAEGFRDRLVNQINGYHGPMRLWRGRNRAYGAVRSVL